MPFSSATFAYGASSVTITEPGGDSVVLNLNGSNDLTSIVDGAGFTRSLTYNDHEVTTDSWAPCVVGFAGTVTASMTTDSYNLADQLVLTARGPDTAVFTLDADGNPLSQTDYMVVSGTTDTASTMADSYDLAGRLLYSVNGVGDTTAYAYDADGNTVQEVDGYGTTDSATTQYQYDLAGGRTEVVEEVGSTTSNTTNYVLNADGRTVGMTQDLGTATSSEAFTYNLAGQLVQSLDANGGTESYVLDADGRVTSESWYDSDGSLGDTFSFSYDLAGNLLTATDTQGTDTFSYMCRAELWSHSLPN